MKHVFLLLIVALFMSNAQAQNPADYSSLRDSQEARLDSVIGRNTFDSLSKTEYSYDDDGRIIREGDYDAYAGGGPIVWTLSSERLYEYNEEGELTTLISGNPVNSLATEIYNSDGLVISREVWTRINFDSPTPTLAPSQKIIYSYEGNKTKSVTNYSWNGETAIGEWEQSASREYTYEGNAGTVSYYSADGEEIRRGTVIVNDRGDFTEVSLIDLNEETGEWANSTLSKSFYDENYNITLSQTFTWRGNDWVKISEAEYRYNSDNQLYYSSNGGQVFEYTFNEDGYVETETYTSYGFSRTTTYTYYFSGNDNPNALTSFSTSTLIVANHSSGIEVIGTESGTPIRVYDLTGVLIKSVITQSDRTYISLPVNTIYIVKAGNQTFKIVTR